jgi:hypothetical protein
MTGTNGHPMPKSLEEVRAAHDLLDQAWKAAIFTDAEKEGGQITLTVLCWVLNHHTGERLDENLTKIRERLGEV